MELPFCGNSPVVHENRMVYPLGMNIDMFQPSNGTLSLSALSRVWVIEKDDIDERLLGNNPDSIQTLLSQTGKDIEQKTGVSSVDQLGLLSLIPGVSAVAMGVAAVGLGIDGVKNFKLIDKADDTERLLELRFLPVGKLNWDWAERLATHTRSWLQPRLESRLQGLNEVLKASQGHQTVAERIALYEKSLVELRMVLAALDGRLDELNGMRTERYRTYAAQSAEAQRIYRDAKQAVELSAAALMFDRTAAAQKIDEIEQNYKRLKCFYSGALTGCDGVACDGLGYCPQHLCFEPGCTEAVQEKSRYCKEHGEQLTYITAEMPKLFAKYPAVVKARPQKPLTPEQQKTKISDSEAKFRRMCFYAVGILILFLLFKGLIGGVQGKS